MLIIKLVCWACLLKLGVSFSYGPPNNHEACRDMKPNSAHHGSAQVSASPFLIYIDNENAHSVVPFGEVKIVVSSDPAVPIRGILLMARFTGRAAPVASMDNPVGYFHLAEGFRDACYLPPYTSLGGKAVSHMRRLDTNYLPFTWVAYNVSENSTVQFFATIVEEKTKYWVKVAGPTLIVSKAASSSGNLLACFILTAANIAMHFNR